jgi:hypothetical protein
LLFYAQRISFDDAEASRTTILKERVIKSGLFGNDEEVQRQTTERERRSITKQESIAEWSEETR